MSFLLGNSRKKRRGFVPPVSNSGPRPSSLSPSTDGGGGGLQAMVQVQRQTLQEAPKTTVRRQDAPPAVTPQQTQQLKQSNHAQGVISMKEVLQDLQVLEEQQRESHSKLQAARKTKQCLESQRTALEQKTGDLKYRDGQKRAELERIRHMLSLGQRQLATARREADRADENMEDFSKKLGVVLSSKRRLLAYQRKQSCLMKRFRSKVAGLQSLRCKAGALVRQTQDRVQELTDRTETLRWRMQDEALRQQSFASQTAHFRGMTSKIELDRELLTTDYSQVQSKHVDRTQLVNESNQRFLQSTEALQKKKVVELASVSEMLIELKQSKALWETHQQELLSAAKRHEDARISHGLGPTAPNCLPSLEMQHFGSLLDRETQATGSENTAKFDLTTQLATVRHKLASLSKEQCTKKEAILQFTAQVEDTLKTAATLKEDATRQTQGFKDALDRLKELQSIHEAKLKQQGPSEELKSDSIREKISKLEKDIGRARTELADSASTLAVYRGARETASDETSQRLEEANCTNQKATACLAALLKNEEDTREGYYSEEGKRTKAEIDQIKSEYAVLENLEVVYDPSLQWKEQAKRDLSGLVEDWNVRIESAKKMRKRLDEAHHQEKEARSVLKRHADKVDLQKEEARRRRERRLGALSKSDGVTPTQPIAGDGVCPKESDAQNKEHQQTSEIYEEAASLSAVKPRNLLETLSQTPKFGDEPAVSNQSVPSSQKRVSWREDTVVKAGTHHSASKGDRTDCEKQVSKTFGGNSFKPNPFLSSRKSSKDSPSARTDPSSHSAEETSETSRSLKTSEGRRLELAEETRGEFDQKAASSKEGANSRRAADKTRSTGKGKTSIHSKRRRSSFSKASKRVGSDLLGASAPRMNDSSNKDKESNKQPAQDPMIKTKQSKRVSKNDLFRSKSSEMATKASKRQSSTTKPLDGGSRSEPSSKSGTSSVKRSQQVSGISSTEHRVTKQRRRGATKVAGTKSFGEDVAFSF